MSMSSTYTVDPSFVSIDPLAVITVVMCRDTRTVFNSADVNSFLLNILH